MDHQKPDQAARNPKGVSHTDSQPAAPPDQHDPTVAHAELDTLAALLREPIEEDGYSQEPACLELVDRIKQFGADPPPAGDSDAPQPDANLGQLGQYQLLEKLGEGGMGAVYRALHQHLEKVVALKVLAARRVGDDAAVARFNREMRAAGRLTHTNIVAAFDAGEAEGSHYLVMELVDGFDLGELVRRLGPLPVGAACELIRQAALGLDHAHRHGLVHRDVKPSNLMLSAPADVPSAADDNSTDDSRPTVKLLDLGLARIAEQLPGGKELTSTGQMMGTFEYMAPEQGSDSHAVDHRADIYSLGATLYKLLTGQAPFDRARYDTPMKQLMALATEVPTPVRAFRPEAPKKLEKLLQRMLARDPHDRPASAAEVAATLAPWASPEQLPELLRRARSDAKEKPEEADGVGTQPACSSALDETAPTALPEQMPAGRGEATVALGGMQRPGTLPAARGLWPRLAAVWSKLPPAARFAGVAAVSAAAFVALALLLTVKTPEGTLLIECDEPGVQVLVKQNGETVDIVDAASGWKVGLADGRYDVELTDGEGNLTLSDDEVTLTRGGKAVLRVTRRSDGGAPPLAKARFSPEEARQHQQAWADYLGVPVEWENSIGMTFRLIPPGEFLMGSTEEEVAPFVEEAKRDEYSSEWEASSNLPSEVPKHRVMITRPFYLGSTEVTQEQYERVGVSNPSHYTGNLKRPVEQVTWDEAVEFCQLLSQKEDKQYRLPTEAEWEYACRAGSTTRWCCGDNEEELSRYGWYHGWQDGTHPVGRKKANAFGLYDMHGNVGEWCQDWYGEVYYSHSPTVDPTGPKSAPTGPEANTLRVFRGGTFGRAARACRSAARSRNVPTKRYQSIGFRVVCVINADMQSGKLSSEQDTSAGATEEAPSKESPTVAPYVDKGWVRFINRMSDRCIGVKDGSTEARATLHQYDPVPGNQGQQWRIESTDRPGLYRLKNRNSGLYVTLEQPRQGEGYLQRPLEKDDPAAEEFLFKFVDIDGRWLRLVSAASELDAGIWGSSMREGEWLIQWPFSTGATDKYWRVEGVEDREQPAGSEQWVDLMPLIKPKQHSVFGTWQKAKDVLRCQPIDTARLLLPVRSNGDFDLEVEFTAAALKDGIVFRFPVGKEACRHWLLHSGTYSGLEFVDGRSAQRNETTRGLSLKPNQRYTWKASVRLNGENATIEISLDDQKLVDWAGPTQRIHAARNSQPNPQHHPVWLSGDDVFALAAIENEMVYHSIRFRAPGGDYQLARPDSSTKDAKINKPKPFPEQGSVEEKKAWVVAELKRLNPGFDGKISLEATGQNIHRLILDGAAIHDLTPIAHLRDLRGLWLQGTLVANLRPLGGLSLVELYLNEAKVKDLSPLEGMKLSRLELRATPISSIAALTGMPLRSLDINGTQVKDLTPLRGMPLQTLIMNSTPASDLSPLAQSPLNRLSCSGSAVKDLSALKQIETLRSVEISGTEVSDLVPLADKPLTWLNIESTKVSDLTPIEGAPLQTLLAHDTRIADLSPLAGMPLRYLDVNGTAVTDLSPLKGMPLEHIEYQGTRVQDPTALEGLPLVEIKGYYHPQRDASMLRQIKTLKTINGRPAAEVLKEAEEKLKQDASE